MLLFFFFFFSPFSAAPMASGSFRARDQIQGATVTYVCHSDSNAGSFTHWARKQTGASTETSPIMNPLRHSRNSLIDFDDMSVGGTTTGNFGYGMLKRKTGRKNMIHNKKETLGPGTSTALKTDCATIPHNPLYLEKEAPHRCKACMGHVLFVLILCSPLRGPILLSDDPAPKFLGEPPKLQRTTTTALGFIRYVCVNLVTATRSPPPPTLHESLT